MPRCECQTQSGARCRRNASEGSRFCFQHQECSSKAVLPPKKKEEDLRIDVYHGDAIETLLKEEGEELIEEVASCWRLSENYLRRVGDLIVLRVNGQRAGFATMAKQRDRRYYLATVCIFPSHRGGGLCSRFIEGVVTHPRYAKSTTYLEVAKDNAAAIRCYTKAGFVRTGSSPPPYQDEYDVYERVPGRAQERARPLNLLVYSMACNAPGLPERTGAVSLELGVMADLGKLVTSAWDAAPGEWRVMIYTDAHPRHTITILTKPEREVVMTRTVVENPADRCADRVHAFISRHYDPARRNGFVIGGHGMIYEDGRPAEFWPVAWRRDGSIDILPLPDMTEAILSATRGARFDFAVLDSCCLCTLENAVLMHTITDYLIAYQQEGPWNGFVSSSTLEFCSGRDIRTCLEASMQRYAQDSASQENPSPVTLLYTPAAKTVLDLVKHLPRSGRRAYRDLLSYAISHRVPGIRAAFDRLVLAYSVPRNYSSEEEEHGISHLV